MRTATTTLLLMFVLGCGGSRETIDAAGDDGGIEPSDQPERAGTRFKPVYREIVLSDGAHARQYNHFFDTQLNIECGIVDIGNGNYACLPSAAVEPLRTQQFADANCTQQIFSPLYSGGETDWSERLTAGVFIRATRSFCDFQLGKVANPIATPAKIFVKYFDGGFCREVPTNPTDVFYQTIERVPLSKFGEFTRTEIASLNVGETQGTRIKALRYRWASTDGAYVVGTLSVAYRGRPMVRSGTQLMDTARSNSWVAPFELGAETLALPGQNFDRYDYISSKFVDAQCSIPAGVLVRRASMCTEDSHRSFEAVVTPPQCATPQVYSVAANAAPQTMYDGSPAACSVPRDNPYLKSLAFARAEISSTALSAFASIESSLQLDATAVAQGGLVDIVAPFVRRIDGLYARQDDAGAVFRLKSSGTVCQLVGTADGKHRCAPTTRQVEEGYQDPLCTQKILVENKQCLTLHGPVVAYQGVEYLATIYSAPSVAVPGLVMTYRKDNASRCLPSSTPDYGKYDYFQATAPLPFSDFPEFVSQTFTPAY
jgi:hypothetical protein